LSGLYEPHCEKLICVEKDEKTFKQLATNLRSSTTELRCVDNLAFLTNVSNIPDVSFVDFDAYGCPNLQIQKFFANYPVKRAIMVNVTDGTLFNLSRTVNIDLNKYFLVNLYSKGRLNPEDYASKRRLRRVLPWLQENFIHLLAAKYGFNPSEPHGLWQDPGHPLQERPRISRQNHSEAREGVTPHVPRKA
jgi:hypothetical protein